MEPPDRVVSGPRILRVFFNLGHEWPLWEPGTVKYTTEPSDYGFSDELVDLLRRWRVVWERVVDFDSEQRVSESSAADCLDLQSLKRQAIAVI